MSGKVSTNADRLVLTVSDSLSGVNDLIADACCDDRKGFVARVDEKLTAFVELETAIRVRSGWNCRGTSPFLKSGLGIIADNLKRRGWILRYLSAADSNGRRNTIRSYR